MLQIRTSALSAFSSGRGTSWTGGRVSIEACSARMLLRSAGVGRDVTEVAIAAASAGPASGLRPRSRTSRRARRQTSWRSSPRMRLVLHQASAPGCGAGVAQTQVSGWPETRRRSRARARSTIRPHPRPQAATAASSAGCREQPGGPRRPEILHRLALVEELNQHQPSDRREKAATSAASVAPTTRRRTPAPSSSLASSRSSVAVSQSARSSSSSMASVPG